MSDILAKLREDRVFKVKLSEDRKTLTIKEKCDKYYRSELTRGEVIKLSKELRVVAGFMNV